MPNNIKSLVFITIICFKGLLLFSQTSTNPSTIENISNAFERYFELERENIHVQLDKNIFITNESIWFKGYVYNKKQNLPFYETTNVYVQLIDESGQIVTHKLLYSMSGFFSGNIKLDKNLKSGHYYLQFYTNWMNNFEEDESHIQRIKIKNVKDKETPLLDKINPIKINIAFYPEGGNYITNVSNTLGIKVTDINGKSIPNCILEIKDSKNVVQKSIPINAHGMGKFDFVPDENNYKAVVTYGEYKLEENLPVSISDGIAFEVNNYIFDNKTMVKIKYNKDYGKILKNKNLFLVIQKNEKSNIIDIQLNTETGVTEFFFSNELLFSGVNAIRIIDSEMNEMAQRSVYLNDTKSSKITLNTGYSDDKKTNLSGNTNWPFACLSVSLLPTNTKIPTIENSITNLSLNAFLTEKIVLPRDYFSEINRSKKYELDLMVLTQKTNKYNWTKIKNTPASPIYKFEKGLDIKGTINSTNADLKKCRIQLKNVLLDVLSSTEVIEKNEFFFYNTTVTDSLPITCSLMDKKDRSKKEMNYYLTVINKNRKFNKNYIPTPYVYPENKSASIGIDEETPRFNGEFILLEEVEVKQEKPKLKRQSQLGNSYLKGFKVGVDVSENTDVLTFIEQNGFSVNRNPGFISITGRGVNSLYSAPPTPLVFIDGVPTFNFEDLFGLRMTDLEEIYISSTAIVASITNNRGIIKLFRKQGVFASSNPNDKPKIITGGFQIISLFENADYVSENTTGFQNFGVIHWSPWILTDENGNLKVTIPNKKHNKAKVLIEGLTLDGTVISEIREVNLAE
jgi:hypothetical protein